MDIVVVLLRLTHIVAGVIWFGVGFTQAFIVAPGIRSAGVSGMRFSLAMNQSRFARMIFPAAAGITMLAGILLYITGSASHFSSTGNMVLGTGALFGIIAGIHGGMFTGKIGGELNAALSQHLTDSGIAAAGAATVSELSAKLSLHTRISFVLMVISLVGMASARYL